MDRLLSTTQAAAILGIHPNDMRHLMDQGRVAYKKLVIRGTGKCPRRRILESELKRFIASLPQSDDDQCLMATVPPPTRARGRRSALAGLEDWSS